MDLTCALDRVSAAARAIVEELDTERLAATLAQQLVGVTGVETAWVAWVDGATVLTVAEAGREPARLRSDPDGDGVWLRDFTHAFFRDFLPDNVAGACFVLRALSSRTVPVPAAGTVESMAVAMAHEAFAALLCAKTEEALEQRSHFAPAGGAQ